MEALWNEFETALIYQRIGQSKTHIKICSAAHYVMVSPQYRLRRMATNEKTRMGSMAFSGGLIPARISAVPSSTVLVYNERSGIEDS